MTAAALSKGLVAASDKVNIAVMGVRGQGKNLTRMFASLPDVNIPYLCDVDANVFGPAAKIVEDQKGVKPQLIGDIRKALDDKNVDAIVIATPDHCTLRLHCWAAQQGRMFMLKNPAHTI
jgi:predicted dehydrogenase